ncbi:MAG: hypothetical protein VW270_31225 [Candidatus Poseidoniales archaeon]
MAAQALAAGAAAGAAGKAAENAPQISKAVTDYKAKSLETQDARIDITKRQVKFFGGLALVVIGGVIAWRLGAYLVKQTKNISYKGLGGGASQATKVVAADGSTSPNINTTQAITLADQQYSGMQGWGTTDFNGMYNSLRNVNGKGLQMVAQQFGLKSHGTLWSDEWNIFQWYNYELSGNQLSQMRNLWDKSGLTF